MRRAIGAAVISVAAVGLMATATLAGEKRKHRLDGTIVIDSPLAFAYGTEVGTCQGDQHLEDIQGGEPLRIRDGRDRVVATARLDVGETINNDFECKFTFTTKVPIRSTYVIEAAGDEIVFTRRDLKRSDWNLDLRVS